MNSRYLLEEVEDRYLLHSTIVTSQLPISALHGFFEEPHAANAIMNRLIHGASKTK